MATSLKSTRNVLAQEAMRMCRKEAGVGQSYAHWLCVDQEELCSSLLGRTKYAECKARPWCVCVHSLIGMYRCIPLLLLLVTMLDDTKTAVMRSNDGLHMDNCFLWHIAHMLANLSNPSARFLWPRCSLPLGCTESKDCNKP